MKLSDFDFELPEDLIATRPMTPRSAAKLLFAEGDVFHDKTVEDRCAQTPWCSRWKR